MSKLLIFGHGYTTKNLTKIITKDFSEIFVTSRQPRKINDKFVSHVVKYEESGDFLISKKNDLLKNILSTALLINFKTILLLAKNKKKLYLLKKNI